MIIQHGDEWLCFTNPVEVLTARTPNEVFQCLELIERSRLWAAGFISYEAAGAFDEALKTHEPGALPLLQFGLFEHVERASLPAQWHWQGCPLHYQLGDWAPSVSRDEYVKSIAAIKEHIAAGDTYQVNYTFRLNADFEGDPFAFFCDLITAQQGGHGAYIETDEFVICSASPELFFELKDGVITARPMKGTAKRGLTVSKDWKQREALKSSEKDRAENIMIVDMIRNDIGRVAEPGSVETVSRFDVEKYPTVWQLTSTVQGKVAAASCHRGQRQDAASTSEVLNALFPCSSITGAPKAKTMEIIQGLEPGPRGIYTGSIGFIAPNGDACFNVAIRTAVLEQKSGRMEYGIGGGVVWDSDSDAEYEEALSKAAILTKKMPEFELLETMLWENGDIFLLERHLKRLVESAAYFDFECDINAIRDQLCGLTFEAPARVRLLLRRDGRVSVERGESHTCASVRLMAVAKESVDSKDVFLYHKTTNRTVYERASSFAKATADKQADFPSADDVLLYNERGEVTESCIANVVVELDGRKITPPVECGLLAGTFREELLEDGEIEERVVMLDDLKRADAIWLINSVRKWQRAVLI
jgi:para-aminobenzoate synthetase/4-amino-4-deoxychorismate lyase